MRIGILGGTFDPVHIAHLVLAESAREQLSLQTVLFLPAGNPWRKAGRQVAPAQDRMAMLRLAIEDAPFQASTLEMEKEGPSYTAETLEELHRSRPGGEFFFTLGEDALLDLPNWYGPRRIIELATLAVAKRPEVRVDAGQLERMLPGISERVVRVEMPLLEISASDIRERVRRGRSIRYLVPPAVEAYIRERRLYRD